jgi:PAS domain S-box-containing protein
MLIVEDDPVAAELAGSVLKQAGYPLAFEIVGSPTDFEERLARADYDAILCDHNLRTWTRMDAQEILKRSGKDIPFLALTAVLGDEDAVKYVKRGPTDYHLKVRLERLPNALSRFLSDKANREETTKLQQQITCAKRDWDLTFDSIPDPIMLVDEECGIQRANHALAELVGLELPQIIGKHCYEVLHRSDKSREDCPHLCLLKTGTGTRSDLEEPWLGKIFEFTTSPLSDSSGALRGSVNVLRDITERKRAEEARRESEEQFRSFVENVPLGVYRSTPDGRVLMANPALLRTLGYESWQELASRNLEGECSEAGYPRSAFRERIEREGEARGFETAWKRRDGSVVFVRESARAFRANDGRVLYYDGIVEDVTKRRRLEEQLRQAQKTEAVGRLASGVAHDFNNLLTIIIGYSDLLLKKLTASGGIRPCLEEIKKAGEGATSLTRQLLAFSRKQVLQLQILDLDSLLTNVGEMLRRVIGEDIELVTRLPSGLGHVKVDAGQIEQVIMNLAVNARDAMPQGGQLTLEAANVELDSSYVSSQESVLPGHYVMIAVSDTGIGMDAETQAHIFEPFFTTKEQGKGTGLGLATVHGIVKQSEGHIWVYSEPGKGTTFKVYLPRIDQAVEVIAPTDVPVDELSRGSETILLVKDEGAVWCLVKEVLESSGYEVLEAKGAHEALEVGVRHKKHIHLLLTDVVMPQMSGRELVEHLALLHPETKVLCMSGYMENAVVHDGLLDPGTTFLQKPFTPDALTLKVREVLDGTVGQRT